MRRRLFLAAPLALAGCARLETAIVTEASALGITASDVSLFEGIGKGIAEIGELAMPEFAPLIELASGLMAPALANIAAGIATADDVALVLKQTTSLIVATAGAIKVVPSPAA